MKLQARKFDLVMCYVCLGIALLKDEELARDLEYGGQQLLLTVTVLTIKLS